MALNYVSRALETCIICQTHFFLDELNSSPPANPPTIVFKVWCIALFICSSFTLCALLDEWGFPQVCLYGDPLLLRRWRFLANIYAGGISGPTYQSHALNGDNCWCYDPALYGT